MPRTTTLLKTNTMSMSRQAKKAALFPSGEKLGTATAIMRAIAHPLRIQILSSIDERGAACVHEIYETLHIEQSVASQQLRILRLAGLVTARRDGKFIYYEVDYAKVGETVLASMRCNAKAPAEEKPRARILKRAPVMAAAMAV